MTDGTLNHVSIDKGSVLRPTLAAVALIAAGLGLLFWDKEPGQAAPLIVLSQAR